MKILQLVTREDIEYEKFKEINERHKKGWLKTVWYNSIFFPIAELSSSITIGLIAWYGGLDIVLSRNVFARRPNGLYNDDTHAVSSVTTDRRSIQYIANGNGCGKKGIQDNWTLTQE